jgi:hypothetical protein
MLGQQENGCAKQRGLRLMKMFALYENFGTNRTCVFEETLHFCYDRFFKKGAA